MWNENHALSIHLQSLENEKMQLINSNRELVYEKEQIKAEFHSVKVEYQNSQKEKQTLVMQNNQIQVEFQSVKNDHQKLIDQTNQLQKEMDQTKLELQSSKKHRQTLVDQNIQLQRKIDQNKFELESIKDDSQTLLKENKRLQKETKDVQNVSNIQIKYIEIWMKSIENLEDHIEAVIHYSELKKKESEVYSYPEEEKNRMAELRRKIGYDFHESHASEIIIKAIDLIMKFKEECRKFMNALYFNNIEEMQTLQTRTDMKVIGKLMKEFVEEVSGFKYQNSEETTIQKDTLLSTIGSAAYWFGGWAVRMIVKLFI